VINRKQTEQRSEREIAHRSSVEGLLRLSFSYDCRSKQTRLATCEQRPPLRVIRAFPLEDGAALIHLHNLSGGILGGDRLALEIEVGEQAGVQLTSTSATRLYRCRPEVDAATQQTIAYVKEGGLLEYIPDPLIPFAGSRYRQQTRISLEKDAGLFWWETIAPGRTARGEMFVYDLLQIGMEIDAQGRPLALERFQLEPMRQALASTARMGIYRYMTSFYICRVGLESARWIALEKGLQEIACTLSVPGQTLWGVSTLAAHGLVVRALSLHGHNLARGLQTFWCEAKRFLYGREAIAPRKVY
jgi:urease accessory protein